MLTVWKRYLLAISFMMASTGCMDASISILVPEKTSPPSNISLSTEADFVSGEVVTTANGVVIKGALGEVSHAQILSNGVAIEGAFYE